MSNSKKTVKTVSLFLLILFCLSLPFLALFFYGENFLYQDFRERDELAGTIDYVEVGASRCERGFIPSVIDEAFGVNSYNLGYRSMTTQGRLDLLKLELERNPIKTVVLEVSMLTMTSNPNRSPDEGDFYMIPRLGSFSDSVSYMAKTIRPWFLPWAYCNFLKNGIDSARFLVSGEYRLRNKNQLKGYVPHQDDSVKFRKRSMKTLKRIYHSIDLPDNIEPLNDRNLREIITICKDNDIELIMLTMPVTQWLVCKNDNINTSYLYYTALAEEYDIPFFDYNLLKNYDEYFTDDVSFTDSHHLSDDGAVTFCDLFIDTVRRIHAGEDISSDFYADYDELYENMEYAQPD